MIRAYKQMPKQLRSLTQFVIGNQKHKFNRLFYGISIEPAAFPSFVGKIFRPIILGEIFITHLDDVFMQSKTKQERFKVLDKNHQLLPYEYMKATADKSYFFSQ